MTVADGVVYAGSMSGDMVALDATSGATLWKFASGGSVICGPSVVGQTVFWGSGYRRFGSGNDKVFAFSVP
jgi:polyvinyl alcohol dehydrogenase (cytochrome)